MAYDKSHKFKSQVILQRNRERELARANTEAERAKVLEKYKRMKKGTPRELEGLRLRTKTKGNLGATARKRYGP